MYVSVSNSVVVFKALKNLKNKNDNTAELSNLNRPDCALAVPVILDTNMKDGSRPESLDITYIVRGFANPPPQAVWTLNVRSSIFFKFSCITI